MTNPRRQILFEPWNMGDALIAAATAMQAPERLALACNSRWHTLIRAAARGLQTPELLAVDLEYVNRGRSDRTTLGNVPVYAGEDRVLTIRGDPRDYLAARKIFPGASVRCSGWLAFAARRSRLLDLPFAKGWLPVRNRYFAWARMAGLASAELERFYGRKLAPAGSPRAVVHVGAQWRSRQYPYVAALVALLRQRMAVEVLAGPGDVLPAGIAESEVRRLTDQDLIDALLASSLVVTNDSGPMHLSAMLGCRTVALCRLSSIEEWLPPATVIIRGQGMPKGYRPDPHYMYDGVVQGWPAPEKIVDSLCIQAIHP